MRLVVIEDPAAIIEAAVLAERLKGFTTVGIYIHNAEDWLKATGCPRPPRRIAGVEVRSAPSRVDRGSVLIFRKNTNGYFERDLRLTLPYNLGASQ